VDPPFRSMDMISKDHSETDPLEISIRGLGKEANWSTPNCAVSESGKYSPTEVPRVSIRSS
jgi:hypothetical protein